MSHTFRITWINWKWRLRIITCHLRKLIAWAHNTNNCVLSWQITAEFMIKLKKTTLKVSDVCLKQHLGLHLSMLPCLTQILTRLRKPDLLWGDDEDCHDDIYTGYPKKTHFLNCHFAKPGLRVCGLPIPVKQPTVEGRRLNLKSAKI